jgi:hypothetical protein
MDINLGFEPLSPQIDFLGAEALKARFLSQGARSPIPKKIHCRPPRFFKFVFMPPKPIRRRATWLSSIPLLAAVLGWGGCDPRNESAHTQVQACPSAEKPMATRLEAGRGALLASRFPSLEAFTQVVDVRYRRDKSREAGADGSTWVTLCHCSGGKAVTSVLAAGLSQDDLTKLKDKGTKADIAALALRAPNVLAVQTQLKRILVFSRRVPLEYGQGDPGFYDLAAASVAHINTPDLAYRVALDSSEKGYINTFNHFTAQAIITALFSEEVADIVADLHERKNMPALTTGIFTPAQLSSPTDNPVDNYVDMLNNEWGQELGKQLAAQHGITRDTYWTPELLAAFLNDIQAYYMWAFEIGMHPFRADDELVIRFAIKLNVLLDRWPAA